MGIDSTLAYCLGSTARRFGLRGRLCTLGVQDFRTTADHLGTILTAAGLPATPDEPFDFYRRLGFAAVESVDVSDFEGCTHLMDLNVPGVPLPLQSRFDAVYNGGTLEHVFDIRSALRNIFELLAVDGIAIHAVPASGWVDHGFYQISPTLLTDYYGANGFDVLEVLLIEPADAPDCSIVHSYLPGTPGGANIADFSGRWLSYVTARKKATSTWDVVPRQSYYAAIHHGADATTIESPYRPPIRVERGMPMPVPGGRYPLATARRGRGHEWIVTVPYLRAFADGMHGATSTLVLFEDGEPIGPAHAEHADIQAFGRGRYSHWADALHFAPSRNDDACGHEYTYTLVGMAAGDEELVTIPPRVNLNRAVRWSV